MTKLGFYSGSFNPFTRGHMQVIAQAMQKLDKIVIGIGVNPDKKEHTPNNTGIMDSINDLCVSIKHYNLIGEKVSPEQIALAKRYEKDKTIIKVINYTDTTVDAAYNMECQYLVRGERANGSDNLYEKNLDIMNGLLSETRNYDLKSIIIPTEVEYSHFSSSNARGLAQLGEFESLKTICYPSVVEQMAKKYISEKGLPTMPSAGYHNNTHVACMLNWITASGGQDILKRLEFAAAVHDAGPISVVVEQYPDIANLILATDHTNECDRKCNWNADANIFHDADLAILFSKHYGWYAYQVWNEYKDKYSDKEFSIGRTQVLKKLLGVQYKTDYFKRFQQNMIKNINWEIAYWNNSLHTK
ncbi:adenylyltransferase/cytidyltransferase family protein [Lachnospiraceae bacterium OttesenSCG-928-E19]|nr:adenylyltransferase/cytidyltransferase family protein [Lachnospiraceae bacterium OttesenSCG-928-E19]